MPRPADPGEDELYTAPPPQPAFYAEQALLGALLLDPQRLDDVPDITADAFSTPAHSALYTAIRSLPAPDPAHHAQSTQWLDAVLTAAHQQTRGLTASYLHSLIQVCPRPRHAPAYARMVQAEHARRLLRAGAQRLADTAWDTSLSHPVHTTLAEADALAVLVDDLAARFPPHPGSLPRALTPAPTTVVDDVEKAVDEERLMLATATAYPDEVEQMRWLVPDDFTHPLYAGLWKCLNALTRSRAPVDPVTVLWEAQQRGLLAAGLDAGELLDVLGTPAGSPQHWGEHILQRSVLTTAHHVSRRIEALTDAPATTPYQLVIGSRRALADLAAVRTRWQHATSPTPTPRPARTTATTPAPPRAGPPRTTAPPAQRICR